MHINTGILKKTLVSVILVLLPEFAFAVTGTVTSAADTSGSSQTGTLRQVITYLNTNGTANTGHPASDNTINIDPSLGTITLGSDLPTIQNGMIINGPTGSQIISGGATPSFRLFATIESSLTLNNITLQNGLAQGGSTTTTGNGGGGAGFGGGVYVDVGATLTLSNVSISGCIAQGGNGGDGTGASATGGAGANFNTGNKNSTTNTGAGDFPSPTTSRGVAGYGGGAGGAGAFPGGTGGGSGPGGNAGSAGGNGGYCGGGGGGSPTGTNIRGSGGGGNGGGDVSSNGEPGGGFGTGGTARPTAGSGGGGGGFGAGGGGGGVATNLPGPSGGGGFGGGGGGTLTGPNFGFGGSYAGNGSIGTGSAGSGGGAGIGGSIFVGDGAFLIIGDLNAITAGTVGVNAIGGLGAGGGGNGTGLAPDVFLFKGASVIFNGLSNTATNFAIQGDLNAPATITYMSTVYTGIDSGVTINVAAGSTITFNGTGSTYQGGTTVTTGILTAGATNLPPAGVVTVSSAGTFNLTGGTSANVVANNGIFNITGATTASGTVTNNLTMSVSNTVSGGTFNNITPGIITVTAAFSPSSATNTSTINVDSSGNFTVPSGFNNTSGTITTSGSGILTVSNALSAGTVNNAGTTNISSTFTPTSFANTGGTINILTSGSLAIPAGFSGTNGTITTSGTGTLTVANPLTVGTVTNGGTTNVTSTLMPVAASNTGALNINSSGSFTVPSGFTNTGSGVITTNGSGILDISNAATNAASIVNNGVTNITAVLTTNTGSITNAGSGTLTFSTGTDTTNSIINNGTFNVSGTSTADGAITNNATMYVNAMLSGTGAITNASGATLALAANAVVSNLIDNNHGGIINITGAGSGPINNSGTLNVYQPLDATGNIDNTSTGFINLQNAINMPGFTLTNSGTMTISGMQNLQATDFISDGIQNYTITNPTTNDSLTTDCPINLSNGTVNVTSSFSGPVGTNDSWNILIGTAITTNGGTVINVPVSGALGTWSSEISGGTLKVLYVNNTGLVPLPGVDTEIAQVLHDMSNNVTNAGQAALLAAFNSVSSQEQYNYLLNNFQPNTTTSANTIAMQNIGFNKVEVRVAELQNKNTRNRDLKRKRRHKSDTSGIATGDLTPNTAIWLAGIGGISKQKTHGENQGYRSKILGGMLGFDSRSANDDVYGIAFGVSNANVYASVNTTNIARILGYNLMLYGANNFENALFLEWIASGVINKNHGVKVFGVNGIDLSTVASYRAALGGVRFNFGKNFRLNDFFSVSQVNRLQYVLVHQPAYDEDGSVAALHVSTKDNQSILTVGTGVRLGIFNDNSWLTGNRELRAMVAYDVLSPGQTTTANFVVGSESFVMTSTQERFALQLGADCAFNVYKNLNLEFSYNYEVRSGYYYNLGEIKLRYLF